MTLTQYGRPGGSLATTPNSYGSAARAGAFFERRVAGALAHWLGARTDPTHLFHDVQRLRTVSRTGRKLDLGDSNIDHVLLTGAGWVMFDAKGVTPGELILEDGHGQLITPAGERRPQPWLDSRRSYSLAGALCDLTGLTGTMVWVLPEGVGFAGVFGDTPARCLAAGGVFINVDDLAAGELEAALPFRSPYSSPAPDAVEALERHVTDDDARRPGNVSA